ncbi:hypothetical protein [Moorena sp. SIO3H5]|uniref:hypothetical protein n=1 Tax=Moorena sp. SIO3H5 TaxID=2607834 RepID=UPI0025DC34FF|nr:hypothetical protein [Moorena sp. SIO3H5]
MKVWQLVQLSSQFAHPTKLSSRVGWANHESLAISTVIISICPPYKIYKISDRTE